MYEYTDNPKNLNKVSLIKLYKDNGWSSADKPDLLFNAIQNSHGVVLAFDGDKLIGLGNAISDGYLCVYFPHLLIDPDYRKMGIGAEIIKRLKEKYSTFYQKILVATAEAVPFYKRVGFDIASDTQSMWIY
ncbi:MAG: GNAT family N-acetyltransferase [Bdellovibrionales bacterium]|nr:GNAT family N-acetyltransferase [Bdellovibrionales bacterium]NQZ18758.1 GNAT family N-acetyltransferase [Bdellovibrionales bacterium]